MPSYRVFKVIKHGFAAQFSLSAFTTSLFPKHLVDISAYVEDVASFCLLSVSCESLPQFNALDGLDFSISYSVPLADLHVLGAQMHCCMLQKLI